MNTPVIPFLAALFLSLGIGFVLLDRPRSRYWIAVILLSVSSAALLLDTWVMLHADFGFGFDLAYIHNALWNLSEGRGIMSDPVGQPLYSVHSFFNLPFFYPFYIVFDHPIFLNLAHRLFGFLAGVFVFLLAKHMLKSVSGGLAMATAYLLLPATSGFLLVECQPSITGTPFLLAYFWAKERGTLLLAALFATLAGFAYEPFLAAVAVEGIMETLRPERSRKLGIALCGIAFLTGALFFLNQIGHEHLSGSRHYNALGGSPAGALTMLLAEPAELARHIFTRQKVGYLIHLLLPFFFLPLLAPRLLAIAIPELAMVLLADPGSDMYKINAFYHHVTTVVFIYAALRVLTSEKTGPLSGGGRRRPSVSRPDFRFAFCILLNCFFLQFAYHHTYIPSMGETMRKVSATGIRNRAPLVSEQVVPFGETVLVQELSDLPRFHRRRAYVPHAFLSPNIDAAFREGRLKTTYLAIPSGTRPEVFDVSSRADSGAWNLIAANQAGMDIYRISP